MNPKGRMPRHTIIKMPKVKNKERTLEAEREKQLVTYKGAAVKLSAGFSNRSLTREQGI